MRRRRLATWLAAIAPARSRDWIAAMLVEAEHLSPSLRLLWMTSALIVALRLRARDWQHLWLAAGLAGAMIAVDWRSGALTPALLLIALSAALLTRGVRKAELLPSLVASGTLPLAHAGANWVPALWPSYQYQPLNPRDWLILGLIAAIGLCSVQLAVAIRKRA